MKERNKLILIFLIFVVIVSGCLLAYQTLSERLSPQTLMTTRPESETALPVGETIGFSEVSSETPVSDTEITSKAPASNTEVASEETAETVSDYLAPDFTFYDADGTEYALSDFFGKPIVMNFWSSTCPPCKSEMPEFQEVYETMGDEVTFLMIDCVGVYIGSGMETQEKALEYIEEEGLTLPVYFDTDQTGIQTYGLSSFPTTFFIDKNGNLVTYGMGALDKATLEKGISMITE